MADSTKPKIVIEFRFVTDALEWFDEACSAGMFAPDVELFRADSLDLVHGGDMRTFLAKRAGDRPAPFTVRASLGDLVTTTERKTLADRAHTQEPDT